MSETESEVVEIGPGSLLKELREQQGLSVADVADKLKLMEQSVRNIEADDYKDIPITFYKGYIKNYAQLLGIDPDKAGESFSQFAQNHGLEKATKVTSSYRAESANRQRNIKAARFFVKLVSFLMVLAIVYSIYYLLAEKGYWNKFINSFDKENPAQEQPLDTDDNEGELIPETDTNLISMTQADGSTNNLESEQETLAIDLSREKESSNGSLELSDAPINASSEPQETLTVALDNSLTLDFSGDCWIQVIDATGKVLVSGTKRDGHISNVTGQPPYRLTIGDVSSVSIQYQGQAVDLTAYSSTKIAKLVLGA
ncbi:MAG: DUF4115 domain-containing protein [Gammaproteobacteria bacterium]|nr:DUF4115 domain-containing protein [Gammaproteobacteria bacterium]